MDLLPPPEDIQNPEILNKYLNDMYNWLKYPGEFNCQKLIIGDGGNTDYTAFSSTGWMSMYGDARPERYMIIGAASIGKAAAAPGESSIGTFPVLEFASNSTEVAYFGFHVPSEIDITKNIKIGIYWAPTNVAAGGVAWELNWEAIQKENNEVLGAGTTHIDVHDATQELANELLETPYGIIAAGGYAIDDTIGVQVLRDDDDDNDTFGFDAALVHIEIEICINKLGKS